MITVKLAPDRIFP